MVYFYITMRKNFRYRLFVNKSQEAKLQSLFDSARFLYNCALEHRILLWKQWRKSVSLYDQTYTLKEIRKFDEGIEHLGYDCAWSVLKYLDEAFRSFFRRVKRGEKPGFPRFKGRDRFGSVTFPHYGNGAKLKNGKLYVRNVGTVRIKLHRPIEGTIKAVTIKKQNGRFYACFSCDDIPEVTLAPCSKEVGIDVGIKSFAVFSDGQIIDNPKHLKQSETKLKELSQQHSKKRSKRSKKNLSRLHQKVSNQRKDFQHKLSRKIVNKFGYIYVEKLKPMEMVKDNFRTLNRYINDAAWSQFFNFLSYKAGNAGRKFIAVNPKNTTQACSGCGEIVPKDLSVRVHDCPHCGLVMDRDLNAALNILSLGRSVAFNAEATV